jgi:hypothetical protein
MQTGHCARTAIAIHNPHSTTKIHLVRIFRNRLPTFVTPIPGYDPATIAACTIGQQLEKRFKSGSSHAP